MLAQEGWFHIIAINEMSFMDPLGNREVVPKILQPNKDLAELQKLVKAQQLYLTTPCFMQCSLNFSNAGHQPPVAGQPYV